MLKHYFGWASPSGPKARLTVLIFHRVLPVPDPLFPDEVDARRFDEICGWIGRWFQVLPLDVAAAHVRNGTLPARALAITFDDGYADNHDVAMPILGRHGLTATFFIATGFLNGGRMWNDTVVESIRHTPKSELDVARLGIDGLDVLDLRTITARRGAISKLLAAIKYLEPAQRMLKVDVVAAAAGAALPDDLMMTDDKVRALRAAGMCIGGHTVAHPILARLGEEAALSEIVQGKQRLETIVQERVAVFAYPNGRPVQDYTQRDVALVRRAGFDAAVTTAWGAAGAGADLFQLPRFTPWDRTRARFGIRLARNFAHGCAAGAEQASAAHA